MRVDVREEAAIKTGVSGVDQMVPVTALSFASGGVLASGGWDGVLAERTPTPTPTPTPAGLFVWDLAKGKKTTPVVMPDAQAVALSATHAAVSSANGDIHVVDFQKRTDRVVAHLNDRSEQIAISSDGNLVAVWSKSAGVQLIEVLGGQSRTLAHPKTAIHALAFTPDNRFVVFGGDDRSARIVDVVMGIERGVFIAVETPPPVTAADRPTGIGAVATSPDGALVATGSWDGSVRLWDATTNGESNVPLRTIEGHKDAVLALSFSGDGHVLASGSRDRSARVWSVESGRARGVFTWNKHTDHDYSNFVQAVALDFTGRTLASGDGAGSIRFWKVPGL